MRDLDKKRAANRAYYKRLVLKGLNPSKEWRDKNLSKDIEWRKSYYHQILKHDPKHKARRRKYYLKNRHIQAVQQKKKRLENPSYYKKIAMRLRMKRMEFLNRLKMQPCADCGIQYSPWIMDFDHRDPSKKSFCISVKYSWSIDSLKEEIAKCDVVCSNCHRERSYQQRKRGFITRTGRLLKSMGA